MLKAINRIIYLLNNKLKRFLNQAWFLLRRRKNKQGASIISARLNNQEIKFVCESSSDESRIEAYARPTKEPETYEWIDRFIKNGDVFYDIGTNTGGYSLYSVKKYRDLRVYSFDPDVQNIMQLNKNVFINNMINNINGFCVCISEIDHIAEFSFSSPDYLFAAGHSGGMINTNMNRGGEQKIVAKIGSIQLSLDSLIDRFEFPCPNHIKIDVDGSEDKVISGADKLLNRDELKSILIELDYNNIGLMKKIMMKGFVEFTEFTNKIYYEMEKKEHIPAGMGNKVFVREYLI